MEGSRFNSSCSVIRRSAVYKACMPGSEESSDFFCNFWRETGVTPLNRHGDTLLHFLAIYGKVEALSSLLAQRLVTSEDLKAKNADGNTALHEAARSNQLPIAKALVRRQHGLVFEVNEKGETALYVAAAHGKTEVFWFLERHNNYYMMARYDGCTILHAAVMGESYGLALRILDSYPDLAQKPNNEGETALHLLASQPKSFRSGSVFIFKDLGRRPFITLQIIGNLIYLAIPQHYEEDPLDGEVRLTKCGYWCSGTNFLCRCSWFKEIYDEKQRHIVALLLAKKLIRKIEDWNSYVYTEKIDPESAQLENIGVPDPLIQATRYGISEIAMEILKVHPEAQDSLDENGRNILQIAAMEKRRLLYAYLKATVFDKSRMLEGTDNQGNSIMHLAASWDSKLSTSENMGTPPGVVHQMIWEIFWFKLIKYDCFPRLWNLRNADGKTAAEVFEENHVILRKEAEKTIKDMANSVMVVAALIGTVNFAAVFTIPGGFDQNNGQPVLLKSNHTEVALLMRYMGGALFSSFLTIGVLLTIVFSRFETEDFYVALPIRYTIAILGTFYSAGFTVFACLQANILENSLVHLPSTYLLLLGGCAWMALILLDTSFLIFDYLYYVVRYSLSYKGLGHGQET